MSKILITGGAGFIGSNLAIRLIKEGHDVTIYDNLSRNGSRKNINSLVKRFGESSFKIMKADVCDFDALKNATVDVERFYHLAAQVAVTKSLIDPRQDFKDNALGTFNALEAARQVGNDPVFIYSSTNKVYGNLNDIGISENSTRYQYTSMPFGITEKHPIDFYSPYGCSKGAGDQYCCDYNRIFGLRTIVFRQSCCYGYRQYGIEDQGWVAWFMIAAMNQKPINIYGDGKQVRDLLFIDDLLDAYEAAIENIEKTAGLVFNIGGGPNNTISVWSEFCPIIEELVERKLPAKYYNWRNGDQKIYISDIRKAQKEMGWFPKIDIKEGLQCLYDWFKNNDSLQYST